MERPEKILVATDFSEAAELGARAASMLARMSDVRVTLIHVLDVERLPAGDTEQSDGESNRLERETHALLDQWRETHLAGVGDVKTALVRSANAANAICEFAAEDDTDLLVLSTHGRTGLAHFMIGSVAERVVRHAPCPVLTLRSKSKR